MVTYLVPIIEYNDCYWPRLQPKFQRVHVLPMNTTNEATLSQEWEPAGPHPSEPAVSVSSGPRGAARRSMRLAGRLSPPSLCSLISLCRKPTSSSGEAYSVVFSSAQKWRPSVMSSCSLSTSPEDGPTQDRQTVIEGRRSWSDATGGSDFTIFCYRHVW